MAAPAPRKFVQDAGFVGLRRHAESSEGPTFAMVHYVTGEIKILDRGLSVHPYDLYFSKT